MPGSLYDLLMRMANGEDGAEDVIKRLSGVPGAEGPSRTRMDITDAKDTAAPVVERVPAPPYEPFEHSRPCPGLLSVHQADWYAWWKHNGDHTEAMTGGYGYRLLLAAETIGNLRVLGSKALDVLDSLVAGAENKDVRNHITTWCADAAWLLGEDERALWSYERVGSGVLPSLRLAMGLPTEYGPRRLAELVRGVEYLNSPSPYSVARRRELLPYFRWFMVAGDAWCRNHAGCWLADLLGRPGGIPYEPFKGLSGIPEPFAAERPLVATDLRPSRIPDLPALLRVLENLHRKAAGSPSRLKETELNPLVIDMVSECAVLSPHLRELVAGRALSTTGRGIRLRRTLVSRLARESARLHTVTGKWLESVANPYGEGGLFASADDFSGEQTMPTHSDDVPRPKNVQETNGGNKPCTQVDHHMGHSSPPDPMGFFGLFGDGTRLETGKAQEWAVTMNQRLIVVLDALNNRAIDVCDAPVVFEEGAWLTLDTEVLALMG